jgi:hypothetical protein
LSPCVFLISRRGNTKVIIILSDNIKYLFLLLNCVCFDRFSSCSLPFAGTMSFLIGAIGGWPPPGEYHMVERQVNNVTVGDAVGVPAQQV